MTITAVQTTMTTAPAVGAPGMLYDEGPNDIVTKIASEAIPFGVFVKIGTDGSCELPDSEAEVIGLGRGVSLHDPTKATGEGYAVGDAVNILISGRVWIQAETAQTIAGYAKPFVRHTATPPEAKGAWRSDADGTDADEPLGMHMHFPCTSGGLGVLQINPPGT